jgi:predicted peptidase
LQLKLSLEILASVQKEFSIDSHRLYVMGLSMGGYATWDVTTRHPEMFAAAVPVCGGGDEKEAGKIKNLPIWAFHGGSDPVVKTVRTRNMIVAIKEAGGNPKYTEYPGVGHDSWTPAFKEPELLPWLFAQKRPG